MGPRNADESFGAGAVWLFAARHAETKTGHRIELSLAVFVEVMMQPQDVFRKFRPISAGA